MLGTRLEAYVHPRTRTRRWPSPRPNTLGFALAVGLTLLATLSAPPNAAAQVADSTFWSTDGVVYAVARSGDTLFVGGSFSHIAAGNMGGLIPVDAVTGLAPANFPSTNGTVSALVADGAGGWFVGGDFSIIGGVPRANLARIRPDRSISDWAPSPDGAVGVLRHIGGTLYVGGVFQNIGGQSRPYVAAVDTATGMAASWNPGGVNSANSVAAFEVKGDTVFVGGAFTTVGATSRWGLAAVSRTTGSLYAWNASPNASVTALRVYGGLLYVAGHFTSIGGASRTSLACLDANTALATTWTANTGSGTYPRTLDLSGNALYVGGDFTTIGGQSRNRIAAYDLSTGTILSWNPNANSPVDQIVASGPTVYACGGFSTIGGATHRYVAAIDSASGSPQAWEPGASSSVTSVAPAGGMVYLAGSFTYAGGPARSNIAAFHAITGTPLDWNPGADGTVRCLTVGNGNVYVGGDFTTLGGQTRNRAGAFDLGTGALSSWNPNVTGTNPVAVYSMALSGSTLYVGGKFSYLGGTYRANLGAVDATTGSMLPFTPSVSGTVYSVCSDGAFVYAADFTLNLVYCLSTTGATIWSRSVSSVRSLAITGSTLFLGGDFTSFQGYSAYKYLVAVTAAFGAVTPTWSASYNPNGPVTSLLLDGAGLYLGGSFTLLGVAARSRAALIDTTTGAPRSWTADPNSEVYALAKGAGRLYLGGAFSSLGSRPHGRIGFVTMPPPTITTSTFYPPGGYEGNAGWTSVNCRIGLTSSCAAAVTVDFATADSTATVADGDYAAAGGTLTFQPGETVKYVPFQVNGDLAYEPGECFNVRLSNATEALIAVPSAACWLVNDDGVPTLSVRDVARAEGASGTTPFGFALRLSNPTYLPVSVTFTTQDSTATVADNDYDVFSGTVTIPAKADSVVQTVMVRGDTNLELDEVFKVVLASAVNATLSDSLGIGTILSDEMGPNLTAVTDVPDDQGGWVWLSLDRCLLDDPSIATPVLTYNIWRKVPTTSARSATAASTTGESGPAPIAAAADLRLMPDKRTLALMANWPITLHDGGVYLAGAATTGPAAAFPPGTWGIVGSFAAMQQASYLALAPAQADSPFVSEYVVSAHTTSPSVWVVGWLGSGRSVDNIAPGVPAPFVASLAGTSVSLAWGASTATDFQYFRLYRGTQADFAAGPSSLVNQGIELAYRDTGAGSGTVFYKLTALDHFGNESAPATASVTVVLDAEATLPTAFALRAPAPNPTRGDAVLVFALPRASRVRVGLYDITGRLAHVLVDGDLPAGWHTARWDGRDGGGHLAMPGMYLCRMTAPGFARTERLLLLR